MGSKGGTTQQTSSSSGPPPQVMAEYQGLVNRATNVANQPYQPYQGEMVAPLSNQTMGGLGGISQYANAAQPYLGAAGAMTMGASAPVNPEQYQGMGSLAPYMNPFTKSVVDTTQAEMNNQNQQQAQFLNSANISSGAFGGDRAGIGQSILANQQQLAEAPTIAGLNQANYTQAMQNWQQQQGVNLGAQQANAARQMSGAAQLGQIGLSGQEAGMQGAQANIQAGMIPQQEQQAIDTAAQQMYQQGQAYPFTTTGWLGNIIEGTGSLSGGQSQTTSPGPNSIAQGLGAATQGIGLLGSLMSLSDERAKENVEEIGKTYDGQNIYRYNFKGDPRTQIGLLAQEEAYHDPGSVQRIGMGDLLGIDYGRATEGAAERGHFAGGGMPSVAGMPMTGGGGGSGGSISPDYDLMMSGDPGARMGLGSMGLLAGTSAHPQPQTALASSRPMPPAQAPTGGGGMGSLMALGSAMPPVFPSGGGGRQGFQSGGGLGTLSSLGTDIGGVIIPPGGPQPLGPNGQFGYATPGFNPQTDQVGPAAGVSEALFGEESAGSKNPYTGIDTDQINAIGGGQWMPPRTNSPMPDWQNLQNSPQFGSAEASLAGLFGGSGSGTQPAANSGLGPIAMGGAPMPGAMGEAGATQGGLSRDQLGQIASKFLGGAWGGGSGSSSGGTGSGSGGSSYTPGSVPAGTDTLDKPPPAQPTPPKSAPLPMQQDPIRRATEPDGMPPGETELGRGVIGGTYQPTVYMTPQSTGRAGGGGVDMRRAGFQSGGFPVNDPRFSYYTPTTGNARGATYHPPQPAPLPPPAIHIQRQLQRTRVPQPLPRAVPQPLPRAVAPPFHQPDHPSTARYPGWPTPGPGGSGGGGDDAQIWPWGPTVRFGAKLPKEYFGPREGEPGAEPPPDESWKTKPYGGRSTNYGPPRLAPPETTAEPMPSEGFNPGAILRRLPGLVTKGALRRIPLGDIVAPTDELAPPSRDEAPRWSWPQPQNDTPAPTIHAGPPQSHVTDLGTWDNEGGAPGPTRSGPSWPGPAPADLDSQVMQMGDEGPQRFRGGRIGRADGGDINTSYGPQQPVSDMSDAQFGRELQDEMRSAPSGSLDWIDSAASGLPDDSTWNALSPGGGGQRAQVNPRAIAQAPTFQGGGGGGGGGGYRGDPISLMGGPPITAGHYVPTTGNAQGPATWVPGSGGGGAGISPNARAQAPEHPAITTMRHIVRTHDAMRGRGRGAAPNPGIVDPEIVARQRAYNSWVPPGEDYLGGANTPSSRPWDQPMSFQGGGGVLGASPIMNATGSTPQGAGLTGQTSQGGGLGSIATAKGAAGGFGDLFGGGDRAGFASGGGPPAGMADGDPFLAMITSSMPQAPGGVHGPPQPPEAPKPPAQGQDPTKGLGDSLGKLGSAAKGLMGGQPGQQTTPVGSGPDDTAPGTNPLGYSNSDESALNLSDADFAGLNDADLGFATGGGVGIGSLRGHFSEGGAPDSAPDDQAFDQAFTQEVRDAPSNPAAAPAPVSGGGAGGAGGGGGGAPAAGGISTDRTKTTPAQRAEFYREYIKAKYPGKDPNVAIGIAGAEGLNAPGIGASTVDIDPSTGRPFSYGDFQMNIRNGLGNVARAHGYDPMNPNQWQDVGKFAIDTMYGGQGYNLGPWKGDKYAEAYKAGHAGQPTIGGNANVPSAGASPASMETSSYGGGFQIPPGGGGLGPQMDRHNLQAPTFGDELKHDPFGYMMSVGAAMMASRAPQLGTAIGEGFEGGNKFLEQSRDLERNWNLTQAQINNMSAEARDRDMDVGLKAQQIQMAALQAKLYIAALRSKGLIPGGDGSSPDGATGGSGTTGGGLTPLPTLSGGTPASGAPSGSGGQGGAGPTVTAGGAPSAGAAPAGSITSLNDDPAYKAGVALEAQGNQQNIIHPGLGDDLITRGKAQQAAAKEAWEKQAEIASKGQEAVTSATTEAQKPVLQAYLENREKFESTYDQTRSEIGELSNIYQHFQAGRQAEAQAELASWANAFGFKLPQAASADAAMKSAIQQAFAAVANSGLQKAPRAGLREATMMVASPTRDPAALRKILTDQLATLDYQHDMYTNVPGHNLAVGDDMDAFTSKHKYGDYLGKARKEIPIFKGITPQTLKSVTGEDWPAPLPKQGAVPGERYSLPNGKVVRAQPDGSFQVEYEP